MMLPKHDATEKSSGPQTGGDREREIARPHGALRWISIGVCLVSIGLIVWSFTNGGKEAIGLIPLGVLGLIAGFLMGRVNTNTTNYAAISGALFGLLVGGFVGATCGLGQVAIEIMNPSLPPRDFEALFGGVIGGVTGAMLGALAAAATLRGAQMLARKDPNERQST